MGQIIEHGETGESGVVRVGDTSTQVSIKVYQDIYHQVTGRTEQIRKRYSENLLVTFSEVEQLHMKIMQLCDVHKVVARNETISVFHDKERKEQFTSFERFRAYNSNSASPTVHVVLKYNFSIIPAGLERPQEYVVSIRLISRVGMLRQIENEAPPFLRGSFIGLASTTAEVTIDYADYVIARGFVEATDEWVRGCRSTPRKPYLDVLRNHSHHFPKIMKIATAGLLIAYSLQAVPNFFLTDGAHLVWARFAIIYSGGGYILITLAGLAGSLLETAVDRYPQISYLNLNKGDEKLISECKAEGPAAIIRLLSGFIMAFVLAIVAAKLEKFI